MQRMNSKTPIYRACGFTLVELLVAMALGLILTLAVSSVYLFTKSAFSRQEQLASLQQSVRTAFEYLATDARVAGHLGCYTGATTAPVGLSATDLRTNFGLGIEGYEYNTGGTYTLASLSPANTITASAWNTNIDANGTLSIPLTGAIDSTGATPGSDVLVIRSVLGQPLRLKAAVAGGTKNISIESVASGKCSNGTTDKVSGFCVGSYGLVASCTKARLFSVAAAASSGALTAVNNVGDDFVADQSEVFPLQTIAYYVEQSSNLTTTSLYRKVFTGDPAVGAESQELIEGVENMQVSYGVDSSPLVADGVIDSYQPASAVGDWKRVVAVRLSLLVRAADPAPGDVAVPASGVVGNVTVTYPSGTGVRKYDRRVFTTTIALRNKIAHL
jgi:type IV pilus assembly protein PilW